MARKTLSKKEIIRIMSLETISYNVGNETKNGKFDPASGFFYQLDNTGNLTGKYAKISDDQIIDSVDINDENQRETEIIDDIDKKHFSLLLDRFYRRIQILAGNTKIKPLPKKKKNAAEIKREKIFISLFAVLAIGISFYVLDARYQEENNAIINSNENDEIASINDDEVLVIQLTRDMIPGDKISYQDLKEATISSEDFNELSINDAQLYKWSRAKTLIDKCVTTYIPEGQYLTYDNVDSVYTPPSNPWIDGNDTLELVSIPIPEDLLKDDRLNYGTVIDITLVKRTVSEADVTNDNKEKDIGNLEHKQSLEQSYVLDTYKITATIKDLLDNNGHSLYDTFTSWSSIPVGEQEVYLTKRFKSSPQAYDQVCPKYISIEVNQEQSKKLAEILGDDTDITFAFKNEIDDSSELKKKNITRFSALFETIERAEQMAEQKLNAEKQKGD